MKILVIENSLDQQKSFAADLRKLGYTVDAANDGAQAIAGALSHDYEAVILDLVPPRESSLRVLHEIREHDPDVGILLLSEQDQIHDRLTALIQGADDYLNKPFPLDELHKCIQDLVNRKIEQVQLIEAGTNGREANHHTNRLIANLLNNCGCDHGPIDLVISEVKLAPLLSRVSTELRKTTPGNRNRIVFPQGRLPTLLVDAALMQHLLVKLIINSEVCCNEGAEIKIDVESMQDYCNITVRGQLDGQMSTTELKEIFRDHCKRSVDTDENQIVANLSLALNYAERMNLKLQALVEKNNRFCVRLSNIKII